MTENTKFIRQRKFIIIVFILLLLLGAKDCSVDVRASDWISMTARPISAIF